jgi:hypothetical protein
MNDMRNTQEDVMKQLVAAYDKVKGKGNWAQTRDMTTVYPHTRGTMYMHFGRTEHLWESKKEGAVAYCRPIHDWVNCMGEEDEAYLNENSINLMCDAMIHIENMIKKAERLNELLALIVTVEAATEYKGIHSDMLKKISQLKKTLGE